MIEIIPAILTDSSDRFKELVGRLEPHTRRIHIDIADGFFVSNKTISGFKELKEIETSAIFDVHLMVMNPRDLMGDWFNTSADRFIIHIESKADLEEIINIGKNHNRKMGLSLNPETDFNKIEPHINRIDFVQFMTVYPGAQGSSFVEEVVDKIKMFHEKYPDMMIMCDGHVTPKTVPELVKAGATNLVVGSYVVKSEDAGKAIEKLMEAAES